MTPIVKTFKYGQHTITLETGVIGKQTDASVMASMDDTSVFVTVVGNKEEPEEERDFFPLTVNYQERAYAAGRFPGGYFIMILPVLQAGTASAGRPERMLLLSIP